MPSSSRRGLAHTIDPDFPNEPSPAEANKSFFSRIKEDVYAALLEYVGTSFFLLLAFGGVQASQSEASSTSQASNIVRDMYISLSFGFSLLSAVWLFYRVTGGLFNPNVTLALLITGVIGPVRFVLYCIAQLLGGITAAAIIYALTPGPLASNTFLGPGVNRAQGVFIEMFITSALVLAVLMLAAEKHSATPFAPIGIGLTLFVCHLWAVYFTGAGMNTARAFGPAVVTGFPYNSHWVYWLGPFLGALLGAGFYALLKQCVLLLPSNRVFIHTAHSRVFHLAKTQYQVLTAQPRSRQRRLSGVARRPCAPRPVGGAQLHVFGARPLPQYQWQDHDAACGEAARSKRDESSVIRQRSRCCPGQRLQGE
ncbi:aquaporin-like protein [Fomes fomentarius]|nr:aquaporin-like protein [Fomes fomentarius]